MLKISAGLLMYRIRNGNPQVLLAHLGGPYFQKKDEGSWTIPKGAPAEGEERLEAARREFAEELGVKAGGPFVALQPVTQKGGKVVYAWAVEGDIDTNAIKSNNFTIEWPPRSGKMAEFPEVDRAEFSTSTRPGRRSIQHRLRCLAELEELLKDMKR